MALSFPLPVSFFGGLKVASCVFDLPDALESSRTADGAVLTASLGERLWSARVTLAPGLARDIEAVKARLSVLREAGRSLLVHPYPVFSPGHDPDGAALAGATVTIYALAGNSRELRLQGLPPGFVLRAGEFMSFQYLDPPHLALHQVVSVEVVADGGGITPLIEVTPHIRPGAVTGATVSLFKPAMRGVIVPGSVSVGASRPVFSEGLSFEVVQVLR